MKFILILILILMAELAVFLPVVAVSGLLAIAKISFLKVLKWGLWFLLLPPLAFVYGHVVGINLIDVRPVEIRSERLPGAFDGYKIVHISDWHLESFGKRHGQLEKIVRKINSLEPDLVVFSGDLVTYGPEEIEGCQEILSRLSALDGVYSVLGNHDYCIYSGLENSQKWAQVAKVVEKEEAMGWKVLVDENVIISREPAGEGAKESGAAYGVNDKVAMECAGETAGENEAERSEIVLAGIQNSSTNPRFPTYGDLDAAMSGVDGRFTILLSHDPTYWRSAVQQYPGIDLTLSGHTHAMQISIFGFSPSRLMFKEYRGLYSEGNHHLYVNIGLGETGIHARVGTPPEITLLTLRASCPE